MSVSVIIPVFLMNFEPQAGIGRVSRVESNDQQQKLGGNRYNFRMQE